MIEKKDLAELLEKQSLLKQDVYEVAKETFAKMKTFLSREIDEFRTLIPNERVRLNVMDKGDFEIQAFVGSDLLVFHMHTNVFSFPKEHSIWKTSYVEDDSSRAYCGIINIYNFLADSFLQDRMNDSGYLIGRIFVNKDNHFFIEGQGHLGTQFRDFINGELNEERFCQIIRYSIQHSVNFDLLTPPYDIVNYVSVGDMKMMSSSLNLKTAKRLGFRFSNENDEII
jgi:hypothetical protein